MTNTDVANKALRKFLGIPKISDIDDTADQSAVEMKFQFDDARQFFLTETNPPFARKEVALAISAGESVLSEKYTYVYGYPADCLEPIEIYNSNATSERLEFEIAAHSDKNSSVIWTDQEDAILVYTTDITNLNLYSKYDIEALACLLAWNCCMTLTRKADLALSLQNQFVLLAKIAMKNQKRGQHKDNPKFDGYTNARL